MVTFPPRPTENSDPWYGPRETYDSAIEEVLKKSISGKGMLPDGTDLNNLKNYTDNGVYHLSSNRTYLNLPYEITSAAVLIVAVGNPGFAVTQTVIEGLPTGARYHVRELHSAFSPWTELVSSSLMDSALLDKFSARGTLPDGTDLDSLNLTRDSGTYALSSLNTYPNSPIEWFGTIATLRVYSSGNRGAIVQEFNVRSEYWVRESFSGVAPGVWTKVLTSEDTPSSAIRELANRDNWWGYYDPTDPSMVTLDQFGQILELRDSLGNMPPLRPDTNNRNKLVKSAFGRLSGITGKASLSANLPSVIPQPLTVMALASETETSPYQEAFFGGTGGSNRLQIGILANRRSYVGNAYRVRSGFRPKSGVHLWEVRLDEGNTTLSIDNQLSLRGLPLGEQQREGLGSIRIGAGNISAGNTLSFPWQGLIGPILIRKDVDIQASNRMRDLISTIVKLKDTSPKFSETVRAFSVDSHGDPTNIWGNPDIVTVGGVASITKILNAIIARKVLNTSSKLNEIVEVVRDDEFMPNAPNLVDGDKLSYRDLIYSMLLPSNNTAPRTIARTLGELLPGEGTGREKYVQKMQEQLDEWGFHGAYMDGNPGGGLRASMVHLVKLMQYALEDNFLKEVMETMSWEVVITGPNAREVVIQSTLLNNAYGKMPEVKAFKAGVSTNTSGAVFTVPHSDGTVHIAAIQGAILNIDSLYSEMAILIEAMKTESDIDHRFIPVAAFKYQTGPNPESWGLQGA